MYEAEKKQYDEEGYCVLRNFFSIVEVNEIIKNVDDFIKYDAPKLSGRDINYVNGELNSIHALHKSENYFTRLAAQDRILKAAEVFLDATPELRGAELFAKPAKVGLPSPMHQDNFYWCVAGNNALTMWVALDYCNEENGGLTYYTGSQKLGIINHEDSFAPGSSQKVEENYINRLDISTKITPTVEPGDVLVHHSLTIHGSSANKSGRSRRGFTMQFKDSTAEYDKKMLEHYESHLMEQVKSREASK